MSTHVRVTVSSEAPEKVRTGLLAVPVFRGELPDLVQVGRDFAALAEIAQSEGFEARSGESFVLPAFGPVAAARVALIGLGRRPRWAAHRLRGAVFQAASLALSRKVDELAFAVAPLGAALDDFVRWAAEGATFANYRFDRYRSSNDKSTVLRQLELVGNGLELDAERARVGQVVAESVCMVRDLVNEPPSVCTPSYVVAEARRLAEESGLECTVIDGAAALEASNLPLTAAVGRGSSEPPAFIHLIYRGATAERRVALVGKGVTYDSGGYSMKPASGQVGMHGDMAGGAAVLGAARIIGLLKPAGVEVHFIVPTAENLVSDRAYKVNDVLEGRNGRTVEVANTDAEGRLLLADGLAYAESLEVNEMVDIATLTGANVIALGGTYAGIFSGNDELAERFLALGQEVGEDFWRMPLDKRLSKRLKSSVADLKNSGGRVGSSITGALFLSRFVDNTPWLHIDMAGLERADEAVDHVPKGGTGFGAATLAYFAAGEL